MTGKLLPATVMALVGLVLNQPAHASMIASASATGLTAGCTGNDSLTPGSLNLFCTGTLFASVQITASGPPKVPVPDLTTTTLTVTSGPALMFPVTLDIAITSDFSATPFPGGPVIAMATINNLIGSSPGPFVMSVQGDGNPPMFFPTCTGSCVQTLTGTVGPIPSDAVHYSLTFTAPGQSVGATIQIMAPIPEPVSLALIGSGLFAMGLFARHRRKAL